MRCLKRMAIAGLAAFMAATAAAQTTPPPDLPAIIRNLGSSEFPVREAAQAELRKLPSNQVAVLREAQKSASDEEVKARIGARISEMELDTLLHPPPLSVDIADGSVDALLDSLNTQMGAKYIQATGIQRKLTLHAKAQPFWEILRQVNDMEPFAIASGTIIDARGINNYLRLQPPPPNAAQRVLQVTDGVAVLALISGSPAKDRWTLQCSIYTDPRVRIARYTTVMNVDAATDQNGRLLVQLPQGTTGVASPSRATSVFSCNASFAASPSLEMIKELRGTVTVELLESEKTITTDLTKDAIAPIPIPGGTLTVTQNPNGQLTLKGTPTPVDDPAVAVTRTPTTLNIQVLGADNALRQTIVTSGIGSQITLVAGAKTLVITMTEKTHEAQLPFVLHDIPRPAP